jgi:hypothetical protein
MNMAMIVACDRQIQHDFGARLLLVEALPPYGSLYRFALPDTGSRERLPMRVASCWSTEHGENMKTFAWLAVLVLALLKQDAPASSAASPLTFSGSSLPEALYRADNPNSGLTRRPGARSRASAAASSQPPDIQHIASVTHNYSTSFAKDENPISEGDAWINGKAVGLDWADVRTASALAVGVNLPSKYADPTAVLAGDWGSDQQAEGTIRVKTRLKNCCREVELRLRSVIAPHSITGYEILCSVAVYNPYLGIVRWNGPLNDFTDLSKADIGCADGDILRAVIIGDVISVYKNGIKVLEGKDDHFANGSPGIGFYETRDDIWSKLGFSSWTQFGFSRFSATDAVQSP